MKTYLTVWFNSEGAPPSIVIEKLMGLGFKPIKGAYDFVYEHKGDIVLDDIVEIGNAIHMTLSGFKVLYKLETVTDDHDDEIFSLESDEIELVEDEQELDKLEKEISQELQS